jgi:hypothetical protein
MVSDSESNKNMGKGFAGLDFMVSDVSSDVEKTAKSLPTNTPLSSFDDSPPPAPPTPPQPPSNAADGGNSRSPNQGKTSASGVSWGIAGIVVLVIWVANSENKAPTTTPSNSAPAPVVVPAVAPTTVSAADIEKPSVGRNQVLSVPQIRYCTKEKIRIDAFELVVNNAYAHEVDRFNGIVNDYNLRCGEYRYRKGDVERVQREINPMSEAITSLAKSEWVRDSLGLESPKRLSSSKPPSSKEKSKQNLVTSPKPPQPPPLQTIAPKPLLVMPANARLDHTGQNWECKRGYRLAGNQCVDVQMPANARLDYAGQNWKCKRGYRLASNQCVDVQMPANARLDHTGQNWECKRGYRLAGNQCVDVQMPANARLDHTGKSWECKRGYRLAGNECVGVQMPANARLDHTGKSWECKRGYRLAGNECQSL